MKRFESENKTKDDQLKKLEDEKDGVTLKEQSQRKNLEDKLKAKDTEISHLKTSIDELTQGIRDLQ